jgi:tetratricopeptide (TPR) repeat protein
MEEEKLIGNRFFVQKNYKEAIKHYSSGLNISNNPILFGNRALCYFKLKDFENCISDCDEALKLDPSYFKVYFRRAMSKLNLGQFESSLEDFEESLKFDTVKASILESELYIKFIRECIKENESSLELKIVQMESQVSERYSLNFRFQSITKKTRVTFWLWIIYRKRWT